MDELASIRLSAPARIREVAVRLDATLRHPPQQLKQRSAVWLHPVHLAIQVFQGSLHLERQVGRGFDRMNVLVAVVEERRSDVTFANPNAGAFQGDVGCAAPDQRAIFVEDARIDLHAASAIVSLCQIRHAEPQHGVLPYGRQIEPSTEELQLEAGRVLRDEAQRMFARGAGGEHWHAGSDQLLQLTRNAMWSQIRCMNAGRDRCSQGRTQPRAYDQTPSENSDEYGS